MFRVRTALLGMLASTVVIGGAAQNYLTIKGSPHVRLGTDLILASPLIGLATYFVLWGLTRSRDSAADSPRN